jgi:hypothetical protein
MSTFPVNKNRVAVAFCSNAAHLNRPIIRPFPKTNLWARGLHDTSVTPEHPPSPHLNPIKTQTPHTQGLATMTMKKLPDRQANLLRTILLPSNSILLTINNLQKIAGCPDLNETGASAMAQHSTHPGGLKPCLR